MEDNEYIIVKKNGYMKIEPCIVKYDKTSKRVKSSYSSKTRRYIRVFYLSPENKEKNILFELGNVQIHRLVPITEEEGYIEVILDSEDDAVRFFAKYDQNNVEEANKNVETWFGGNDDININYLEEIYKPCLRIDSKGRIILRCSAYLRNFSPDFDIINTDDEYLEFKDIVGKKVEVLFENKGLIFSSQSFQPLFFVNTIKLIEEDNCEDKNEEISFSRQPLVDKDKFYFNDELSLENYKNTVNTEENIENVGNVDINETNNETKEVNIDKEKEKEIENSVDSQLNDLLETLEKENEYNRNKWIDDIKEKDKINKQLKTELEEIQSESECKYKKSNNKKIKIIKRKKHISQKEKS